MNVFIGLAVMVVCLLLQAVLVAVAIKFYAHELERLLAPTFFSSVFAMVGVMLMLVIGNLLQVSIWALLFLYLGEFSRFMDAAYHSGVNFSTLGYGDIVMSEKHRILGPMQAVNGVLMIGVSTAVVMAVLQDGLRRTRAATALLEQRGVRWTKHEEPGDET